MKISDLLRLSLDNLRRRKGRTALTVIGVVIGTCAIILMISLGIAINAQNEEMLQSWGDLTVIQVYNYNYTVGNTAMDDTAIAQIKQHDHVVSATPYYQTDTAQIKITTGRKNRYQMDSYNIYGVYEDALEAMDFSLNSGTFLTADMDPGKNKIPVLVGENMGYSFEDTTRSWESGKRQRYSGQTDSAGNTLEPFVDVQNDKLMLNLYTTDNNGDMQILASYELVIVGVLTSDYSKHYATDSGMFMRLSDMQMLEKQYIKLAKVKDTKTVNYGEVYVKCDDVNSVADVESWIQDDMGFENTSSMTQIRESMQDSVKQSQMILGGLAAVSLFVAALNIMNTMTMAIYERTREIGVMKVLGCGLNAIRAMFLVESGAIGFIGGVIGSVISLIISAVMNNLAFLASLFGGSVDLSWISSAMGGWSSGGSTVSIIPPWLILLALAFATVVGLISGIAPSNSAVKISSLEAIRHD